VWLRATKCATQPCQLFIKDQELLQAHQSPHPPAMLPFNLPPTCPPSPQSLQVDRATLDALILSALGVLVLVGVYKLVDGYVVGPVLDKAMRLLQQAEATVLTASATQNKAARLAERRATQGEDLIAEARSLREALAYESASSTRMVKVLLKRVRELEGELAAAGWKAQDTEDATLFEGGRSV
jgi:hypothetical protein